MQVKGNTKPKNMTKLEEEMKAAMVKSQSGFGSESILMNVQAKAASEVAKKYIILAVNDAFCSEEKYVDIFLDEWFKENGITE